MAAGDLDNLLSQQMAAVRAKFPGLHLSTRSDGDRVICGMLGFQACYVDRIIETEYSIEIAIPNDFPASPPAAREIGGRVADDFHHMDNGTLCLGAPLEVRMQFATHRSLLGFVEQQLVPFLFAHACFEQDGHMPFGDLRHGAAGILDSYKDLFDVEDDLAALGLLKVLADDNYKGHTLCPCGSGSKLRHCHGPALLAIKQYQTKPHFRVEHTAVLLYMCKQDPSLEPRVLAARGLMKKRHRR